MIIDEKYIKAPKPGTEPKYIGKYIVVKREVNGPYVLRDLEGNIYHRKVPIDQMKVLFRPGMIPALVDDEDVWLVEKLVNDKKEDNKRWYEVKWKGFAETTWEPEEYIHDQNLIDKYWRLKSGLQKQKRGRKPRVNVIYSMTKRKDPIFNGADRTAQTQDENMKLKLVEICAEAEKHD